MELYNNLLPITFGQKGIPAQNVSFKTGFGNDFQGKIWRLEAGGVVYKVPIHQTLEGQVEYLSPDSIPNLTKKIVLECLEVHLSPNGRVKHKEEDHFDFFPDQDSEAWPNYQEVYFRLEVSYLPEMKHKFMLAISAYNASGKTLSGSENFRKVKSFTSRLSKQTIECKGGPTFTLASPFGESFLAAKQLHKPNLLFRPNGMPVNKSAAQGIAEFGPYSSDKFRKTTLRILVIGRKSNRGSMMNFLGDLKGGMPLTHQGANYPWPEGWAKQYNFADAIWEKHFVASYSREEIEAEVRSVMEKSRGLEVKYDLAFFEADPHAPDVSPENDAFCHLKAHLLKYGIASQAISTETLRLPEYARAEALQEIALNAYAKAGGTPWRILVNQDLEHELVVGIGTTSLNKALYGFSTFFSSEGEYLLGQSSIQGSVAKWEMDLEKLI
ncbi:MAG TPA: hypothetical protein ENJ82_00425, partial [Bacteroidetes bacterium]|nr:hypothetical protein [Bacteroidota bacterium]